MSSQTDLTTLVCLFHKLSSAQAAFEELRRAGVAESGITLIGGPDAQADAIDKSALASLEMPDRDYDHLKEGVRDGGIVIAVTTEDRNAGTVEDIFARHSAEKIDEAAKPVKDRAAVEPIAAAPLAAAPLAAAALTEMPQPGRSLDDETAIPVVAEELVVGKRTVDAGGVRVFRRVVEIPAEQSVTLHEEHVTMERRPVDRAVTGTDGAFQERTIELTETAEEAVVAKNARVVEEVVISKQQSEHVETVHDTVRRTEVEVEQVPADATTNANLRRS